MEHAIAITRSQLRQVIENYIVASRVGDTLSYVETAKLSTAEAAESSTERLWAALEALAPQFAALDSPYLRAVNALIPTPQFNAPVPAEQALEQIEQVFSEPEEFVAVQDLQCGQVVFINSRGLIEGKWDESGRPVYHHDAQEMDDAGPRGLIETQGSVPDSARLDEPEPESADDFF